MQTILRESSKKRMNTTNKKILEVLGELFPNMPIYQDFVSQKELLGKPYNYLILKYGSFYNSQDITKVQVVQEIQIILCSEGISNIDEKIIDLIFSIGSIPTIEFSSSEKITGELDDSERVIDSVQLDFSRGIKGGC